MLRSKHTHRHTLTLLHTHTHAPLLHSTGVDCTEFDERLKGFDMLPMIFIHTNVNIHCVFVVAGDAAAIVVW